MQTAGGRNGAEEDGNVDTFGEGGRNGEEEGCGDQGDWRAGTRVRHRDTSSRSTDGSVARWIARCPLCFPHHVATRVRCGASLACHIPYLRASRVPSRHVAALPRSATRAATSANRNNARLALCIRAVNAPPGRGHVSTVLIRRRADRRL